MAMSPGFNMSPAYVEEMAGQKPTCEFISRKRRRGKVSEFQGFKVLQIKVFLGALGVSAVKRVTPLRPMPRIAAPDTQSFLRPAPRPVPARGRRGWPLRSQYPPDRNVDASLPAPARR